MIIDMGDLDNYENSLMDMRQKASMSAKDFIELNSKKAVKDFGKGSKKQPEFALQVAICSWLNQQFPTALYDSDTIAAVRLTIPQQVRNKKVQKDGFKKPDLCIYEPRGIFCGLFLEIKVESPWKKDGVTLKKNEHIEGQWRTIQDLNKRGYKALFVWTLSDAINIITEYMILPNG